MFRRVGLLATFRKMLGRVSPRAECFYGSPCAPGKNQNVGTGLFLQKRLKCFDVSGGAENVGTGLHGRPVETFFAPRDVET